MKVSLCHILAIIAALVGVCARATPGEVSAEVSRRQRWEQDLDCFARELPARHLDFHKLIPKRTFDREVESLRRDLPRLSDVEIVFRLMRLGARLDVAHTWVSYPPKEPVFHGYPFRLQWFSDELVVTAAAPACRGLVGARVVRLGRTTPRRAVAKVAPYISYENQVQLFQQSPLWLRNSELLRLLRISEPDGTLRLSLLRPDSTAFSWDLAPDNSIPESQWISVWEAMGVAPPFYLRRHEPYWHEFLPGARAHYVQYNECADYPRRPFAHFVRELFASANSNAAQRIVIDLRRNGGGNNGVVQPLLDGLKVHPRLNGKHRLLVLIGPATFSAGLDAAIRMRDGAGATLVGLPTGQKPNFYAESPVFRLPNSLIEVHYCTKRYVYIKDADPSSLAPEINVVTSARDFLAGRDPVLETALGLPLR